MFFDNRCVRVEMVSAGDRAHSGNAHYIHINIIYIYIVPFLSCCTSGRSYAMPTSAVCCAFCGAYAMRNSAYQEWNALYCLQGTGKHCEEEHLCLQGASPDTCAHYSLRFLSYCASNCCF